MGRYGAHVLYLLGGQTIDVLPTQVLQRRNTPIYDVLY